MNGFGLSFHHLGLAVQRTEDAIRFLQGLGYRIGETVFDPEQNVNLVMCTHDHMPAVEIVAPGAGPGPIDNFVGRFQAGIIYHACYTAESAVAAVEAMRRAGLRVVPVTEAKQAVLFSGRRVSFHFVAGAGLIELLENADG